MQSSSRSRPFKSGLIGASPITDAIFCPRSSVRLERHRAKVEVASAIPAVDAILPLCLSSHRTSFVNSYSSVRVRPEAPVYGDHDVTAASRPVKAFVPVRIRLVTPFRWAEDDRLSSTIRRAYRPWRKPWRSGFDSRHGVPPFDHVTCPSSFAEAAPFVALGSEPHPRSLCASAGFADSPVVQPR